MLRLTEVKLPLGHSDCEIRSAVLRRLGIAQNDLLGYTIFKRSYDARKRSAVAWIYSVEVKNEAQLLERLHGKRNISRAPDTRYRYVARASSAPVATRPVVIGTGPCGLFAGLILAQMGFHPLILERGKTVRERTKDTFGLWRKGELNPESNVQFGEGGAGTFSDGKLYSQIKDPHHYGRKVLTEFVAAGAPPEILYVSKPHIGTFRLVTMVENMRATICALGGEFRFQYRVTDFDIVKGDGDTSRVRGVVLAGGETIAADHVVLAIGHSARDTFQTLYDRGVYVEAKPFSIGLRIEHPQSLIDRARLGSNAGKLCSAPPLQARAPLQQRPLGIHFCVSSGTWSPRIRPERVVTNGRPMTPAQCQCRHRREYYADDYPGHPLTSIAFNAIGRRAPSRAAQLRAGAACRRFSGTGVDCAGRGAAVVYTRRARGDLSTCIPDRRHGVRDTLHVHRRIAVRWTTQC